jgi:hypothetical protein
MSQPPIPPPDDKATLHMQDGSTIVRFSFSETVGVTTLAIMALVLLVALLRQLERNRELTRRLSEHHD